MWHPPVKERNNDEENKPQRKKSLFIALAAIGPIGIDYTSPTISIGGKLFEYLPQGENRDAAMMNVMFVQ